MSKLSQIKWSIYYCRSTNCHSRAAAQEINKHCMSELLHHGPVSQWLQIRPNPGLNCPVNSDFPSNIPSSRTILSLGHLFQQFHIHLCADWNFFLLWFMHSLLGLYNNNTINKVFNYYYFVSLNILLSRTSLKHLFQQFNPFVCRLKLISSVEHKKTNKEHLKNVSVIFNPQ